MKPTPKGWPRLSISVFYKDAPRAIDWLCKAFGFEVRIRVEGEGGRIEHSELTFGDAMVMVGDEQVHKDRGRKEVSPLSIGGHETMGVYCYVDDVDAHCARARAAGGTITMEPQTHDYGEEHWADRSYEVEDFEGHRWGFAQRMRG
jgi:uncharacterized glyoxalase superfamily protein PhnB